MSGTEVLSGLVTALASGQVKVVDLTQPLSADTVVIDLPPQIGKNSPPFSMHRISQYDADGPAWYWNEIRMGEHTGTHFDAPNHWITGKDHEEGSPATLPVSRFVAPACVIDCSAKSAADADYLLTVEDIVEWEGKNGRIEAGSLVLMRTDWHKRKGPDFLNVDDTGSHCPGPSVEAAKFLARDRDVGGWGVEQVGTDAGQAGMFDPPFPAHHFMHERNKIGLASLTNLDQLPAKGAIVICAPLKIVGGSGSPLRAMALVPA